MTEVRGIANPGPDNDEIRAGFTHALVESEIEDPANWEVETPLGSTFDLSGATIEYDAPSKSVVALLDAGTVGTAENGNDLQTGAPLSVAFKGVHTASGRLLDGSPQTGEPVGGDDAPPELLGAYANGVGSTLEVRFSEPAREVLLGELFSGVPGDPGARFLLMDADATPASAATGVVSFTGLPLDGETLVIDDGLRAVTFEFDIDLSVVETPTLRRVVIGLTPALTALSLAASINGATFDLDVTAAPTGDDVDLVHDTPGAAGNNPIVEAATNVTASGLAGGADAVPAEILPLGAGIVWAPDDQGILLDYGPVIPDPGTDTLEVYGVLDLAGNQVFAVRDFAVQPSDPAPPALELGSSSITAIAGEANDVLSIVFDRPMSPYGLLEAELYEALPLDLAEAEFTFDGNATVSILLNGPAPSSAQFGAPHALTLVHDPNALLTAATGTTLVGNDVEVVLTGGDATPVSQATSQAYLVAGDPLALIVVFSEAIATGALPDVLQYAIGAASPTQAIALTPRALRLTFALQPLALDTLVVQPLGALDLAGNLPPAPLNLSVGPADLTPPTATVVATAVEDAGGDLLRITYDEPPALANALDPNAYAVTVGGLGLDLGTAELRYESAAHTVVAELPPGVELPFGATVGVAIMGVADLTGNVLTVQPGATAVGGDATAPGVETAFVNWIEEPAGTCVDVLFDEDVDATFVEDPANWTASASTPVAAVMMLSARTARVVTLGQLLPAEELQLTGLPDLAGNAAGLLTVDPLE